MADAFLSVLPHAFEEGWLADNVDDVFVDEHICVARTEVRQLTSHIKRIDVLAQVLRGAQTETLFLSLHDVYRRILLALEADRTIISPQCGIPSQETNAPLVLAVGTTFAVVRHALDLRETVDAVGVVSACVLGFISTCNIPITQRGAEVRTVWLRRTLREREN